MQALSKIRQRAAAAVRNPPATEAAAPPEPELTPAEAAAQRDGSDFASIRRLLAFLLEPDACCVDVGAHRGSVLAEMVRAAPRGRHVAFEPLPELAEFLRQQFPGVDVRQSALSNRAGQSSFAHVRGQAEGWSGLRFRPLPGGQAAEVEQIEVRTEALDEALPEGYRPRLIKIDVEGAEQQVLEGALETLTRHRPTVIFEHGSGSAEEYGTSPADIHDLFTRQVGFRIFDLDGFGPYSLEDLQRTFYAGERVNFVAHP